MRRWKSSDKMGRWIVVMVVGVAACGIAAGCKSGDDKYRMGESHRSHKVRIT